MKIPYTLLCPIEAQDITGYNHVRIVVLSFFGHGGGVALVNKEQAYQALVSDVKEYYTAQEAEHHDESGYGNAEPQPP